MVELTVGDASKHGRGGSRGIHATLLDTAMGGTLVSIISRISGAPQHS